MITTLRSKTSVQINLHLIRWLRNNKRLPGGGYTEQSVEQDDYFMLEDEAEGQLDEISDSFGRQKNHRFTLDRQPLKKTAEELQKEFLKEKIVERKLKNIYNPKEPTLLTWAAKMQIKFLNKSDPIYWTPTMLSNSFPVSKDSVIKILRSERLPKNETEIAKHDSNVHKNWMKLKEAMLCIEEGRCDELYEDKRWLADFGQRVIHLLPHASGNAAVTVPPSKFAFKTQEQVAEENKPVVKPYFSTILTSYDEDKFRLKQKGAGQLKPIGFDDETVLTLLKGISEQPNNRKPIKEVSEVITDDSDHNESDFARELDKRDRNTKKNRLFEQKKNCEQTQEDSKYRNSDFGIERDFDNYQKIRYQSDELNETNCDTAIFRRDKGDRNFDRRRQRHFDNNESYHSDKRFREKQRKRTSTYNKENNRQESVLERVQQNFHRQTDNDSYSNNDILEQNYRQTSSTRKNRQRGAQRWNKTVDGSNYVGVDDEYCRVTPLFKK